MTSPGPPDAAFVRRFTRLKALLGAAVLITALFAVSLFWLKDTMFTIDPGSGTPIGSAVRTDRHIALLIQRLEPYVPSPHRDHSKNTFTISVLLVPLDGTEPKLVKVRRGLLASSFALARVLDSDGRALWFDVAGTGAIDLNTFKLLPPSELRDPPPAKRTSALPLPSRVEHQLAAGFFIGPTEWFGLYSAAAAARDLKPGFSVKRVAHADEKREPRRFYRGTVEAEATAGRHRIVSMQPLGDAEYLNAAFVRPDDISEPLRLSNPDGALMVFTSDPGLKGTLVAARVDLDGAVLWQVDTGIDRFSLKQILPGESSTAFVGTRPPVPDKVSEPLLVVVNHADGSARTLSLLVK
jgi:hypothetical protein